MRKIVRYVRTLWLAAIVLCIATPIQAAETSTFPTRPIRLVVGFTAGGPTDAILRIIAQDMGHTLGQSVVVENKPGANSMIASCDVARAPADGYVILGATLADNVNTILTPNLAKCRANRDFEAIGLAATIPMMVVTAYDSPYKTIHDLITYDKASPGSVTYGSAGNGGSAHLSAALLATQSGTRMTHIPFKGNAPALSEVMAGRVSFMFYPMVGVNALTAQKRIRPLSVSLAQRHPDFPNVPTMKESGFKDFEDYTPGVGLLAPLGTSPDILAKLNQALRAALANPETAKRLADLGAIPAPTTPAQYQTWLQKDYERWERVIRAAGVTAE